MKNLPQWQVFFYPYIIYITDTESMFILYDKIDSFLFKSYESAFIFKKIKKALETF